MDINAFRDKPIFVALSDEQIERILEASKIVEMPSGEVVIREGEPGEDFYIILEGKVRIIGGGEEVLGEISGDSSLRSQHEGDFFGEMSIIDHEPRSATVVTAMPTRLLRISRDDLMRLYGEDPDLQIVFLMNISRILSRRLRRMNRG